MGRGRAGTTSHLVRGTCSWSLERLSGAAPNGGALVPTEKEIGSIVGGVPWKVLDQVPP